MPHETETSMGTLVKGAVRELFRARAEFRQQLNKASLNSEPYLGWIAASAVTVGGVLAARGLRRPKQRPTPNEIWDYVDCVLP